MNKLRVYIRQVLVEMAAPRKIDLNNVYFHGTPTTENAESIGWVKNTPLQWSK